MQSKSMGVKSANLKNVRTTPVARNDGIKMTTTKLSSTYVPSRPATTPSIVGVDTRKSVVPEDNLRAHQRKTVFGLKNPIPLNHLKYKQQDDMFTKATKH